MSRDDKSRILDELRDSLGYGEEVSPDLLGMIMTGYDIAGMDVTVADVVYDSQSSEKLVPVRADDPVRILTAEGGGITFELEITAEERLLSGRVIPGGAAAVYLDQIGNMQSSTLDETGTFELPINADSPFRVRLVTESGESVATEWVSAG